MTLRDHYHESWQIGAQGEETQKTEKVDEWALGHISVLKVQPISEAFDDDSSGFLSVTEVNTFTTSRPLDWRFDLFTC
jgi:hypothetical protein